MSNPLLQHFLVSSTYLSYVGRGTSRNTTRKREYALEETIPTCSNIQKFHVRIPFNFFICFHPMSTIKHEALCIFQLCCSPQYHKNWNALCKWECKPHCNIYHHLAFDLYTFHIFSALGGRQDNDAT